MAAPVRRVISDVIVRGVLVRRGSLVSVPVGSALEAEYGAGNLSAVLTFCPEVSAHADHSWVSN